MRKIKTWQEALKLEGLDPTKLPDVSMLPEKYRKAPVAQYILPIVVKWVNGGDWIPDYTGSERKYEPWMEVLTTPEKPSGSGLSFDAFDFWRTFTTCGVRLCFKSPEAAEYCFNQFKELYEDLYL